MHQLTVVAAGIIHTDPLIISMMHGVKLLIYTMSQKKNVPPLQLAIIFIYIVRLRQFLAQMLPRKYAIKMYFIFPPHLTSAFALPGETGNPEIASFHLNAACFFTKKHETQLKISPGQS